MFAAAIVEAIDVMKEGLGNLVSGHLNMPPNEFGFEGFEESFNGGIVVTVTLAAH